jgi:DNA modification methylase
LAEVPTIRLEHLTDAQAKAFMLADNRLADLSAFDDQLLAQALQDLLKLQLDFDIGIEVTGFTVSEIDLRVDSLGTDSKGSDDADRLPPISTEVPVSQHGDLWDLRGHRVYCGNALDAQAYGQLMGNNRASMVFTDPPYNVPIDGHASGRGATHHREFAMASGEMNEAEFTGFLAVACTLMARNSRDGAVHFVCTDWRHLGELLSAGKAAFSELLNLCVWTKHNRGMGSFYRSQHELVFVFKAGRRRHRNNVQLGQFGRNRSNVWAYPGISSLGRGGEEGNLASLHPTVKPVRLVADAILDCSARGEIVLDPFLGSGTTVIAAERVGRLCYGMEIDPLYVDTIVRRWEAYSGDFAVHATTGMRFDDVAAGVEARHG